MLASVVQLDPDLFVYHAHFLTLGEADELLEGLWRELQWSRREITLFGRSVMQPRLVAWYGEPDAVYRYSGLTLSPLPWHPLLLKLRSRVEAISGSRFNSVLANAYRDGSDSMGWHSDDERELGARPVIASVTLGAARRFLLRPKNAAERGKGATITLHPAHGSLLLMKGESQLRFQHALPKTRHPVGLRINLTWRLVRSQAPV